MPTDDAVKDASPRRKASRGRKGKDGFWVTYQGHHIFIAGKRHAGGHAGSSAREQADAHRRTKGSANVPGGDDSHLSDRDRHENRARALDNRMGAFLHNNRDAAASAKLHRKLGKHEDAERLERVASRVKTVKARQKAHRERSGLTVGGKHVAFGQVRKPAAKSIEADHMADSVVYFGEAVKAMGDGRVSGYLVRFGTPDSADSQGEYFTARTYLGQALKAGTDVLYRHGLPMRSDPRTLELGNRPIGEVTLSRRDDGVWAEGSLDLSIPAVKALYAEVERGLHGWSSGSARHRVISRPAVKGTTEIEAWPIIEATLSPKPVDPRNRAYALKALMDDAAGEAADDANPAAPCPKCGKGMACPDCDRDEKAPTKAHPDNDGPDAVAAKGLSDRSARLVADCEELACLYAKAADQRHSEGRHLSRDKRGAIKALSDALARLAAVPGAKADPEAVLALRRRIALGRV